MAAVLIAVIMVAAVLFDAPLEAEANPGLSPNPTKAPWYFAGLQELLLHFHPLVAVLIIPSVILATLLLLPYVRYDTDTAGVWFASVRGRRTAVLAAIAGTIAATFWIIADEFLIDFMARNSAIAEAIGEDYRFLA